MAFERVNGPLGRQYSDDMLANIHEQLQAVQFILGRMSAGEDSPVEPPHRVLRAHEVLAKRDDQDTDPDAMDLEDFTSMMENQGRVKEPVEIVKYEELPGT